jgi:hypothetical protein
VIGDFQSGKDKIDVSAYGITEFTDLVIETKADDTETVTIIDLDRATADVDEVKVFLRSL